MMWSLLVMSLISVSNTQEHISGGKTSQSSDYKDNNGVTYSSERAVDGNLTQCAITNGNSWWNIDLLGLYEISNITIYNKYDINTEMTGAQIYIGNSSHPNGNNLCATITESIRNKSITFQCNSGSMWGRYVTVQRQDVIILCEVWIYGTKKDSGFIPIPENRTWEDSLNYCRDHNMQLAYILDNETQTWAQLEASKSNSPFVWLGLRYTCTLGFWFWLDDHALTYEHWDPEQKINGCDMSVAMETTGNYSWFSKPDNETFNFICRL